MLHTAPYCVFNSFKPRSMHDLFKLIHKIHFLCVLFPTQGGAISILTACERPSDFAGVVLIAPMVQMNPDSATPFKVQYNLQTHSLLCSRLLHCPLYSFSLLLKYHFSVKYLVNPGVILLHSYLVWMMNIILAHFILCLQGHESHILFWTFKDKTQCKYHLRSISCHLLTCTYVSTGKSCVIIYR